MKKQKFTKRRKRKQKSFVNGVINLRHIWRGYQKNHVAHISYLNRVEEDSAKERSVATVYQESQ